ncbi:Kinesin light chain 3, partial [Rhizoclosmatium hyalinum]
SHSGPGSGAATAIGSPLSTVAYSEDSTEHTETANKVVDEVAVKVVVEPAKDSANAVVAEAKVVPVPSVVVDEPKSAYAPVVTASSAITSNEPVVSAAVDNTSKETSKPSDLVAAVSSNANTTTTTPVSTTSEVTAIASKIEEIAKDAVSEMAKDVSKVDAPVAHAATSAKVEEIAKVAVEVPVSASVKEVAEVDVPTPAVVAAPAPVVVASSTSTIAATPAPTVVAKPDSTVIATPAPTAAATPVVTALSAAEGNKVPAVVESKAVVEPIVSSIAVDEVVHNTSAAYQVEIPAAGNPSSATSSVVPVKTTTASSSTKPVAESIPPPATPKLATSSKTDDSTPAATKIVETPVASSTKVLASPEVVVQTSKAPPVASTPFVATAPSTSEAISITTVADSVKPSETSTLKQQLSTPSTETPKSSAGVDLRRQFSATPTSDNKCAQCSKTVYAMEKIVYNDMVFHKTCFKCKHCSKMLKTGEAAKAENDFYCKPHFQQLFKLKGTICFKNFKICKVQLKNLPTTIAYLVNPETSNMGAAVSNQKQNKTSDRTNSSSLVTSVVENSTATLIQHETTHASSANQVLLDQDNANIHTTPVSAKVMSVNVVEGAVETVSDTETERANMLDPNHFSIKGVSVKYFSSLVDIWGGRSELESMTTQDICNKFVKTETEVSKLSWCADMFLSTDPNLVGQVCDANYFISHAWKYKFLDVVDALTNFVDSNKLDPESTIIWFDLLSNSQHNTGAKDFTWWTTVFQNAIQKIGSVVLIMQPWDDPVPLTRAWCVYEIYVSNVAGSSFYVAMPPNETLIFMDSLKKQSRKYLSLLANLNSQNCEAGSTSDQEAIFTAIERTIGFSKLDRTVLETLAVWIIGTLQDHITLSRASQNLTHQIDWMFALAGFYQILSHYEKAETVYI